MLGRLLPPCLVLLLAGCATDEPILPNAEAGDQLDAAARALLGDDPIPEPLATVDEVPAGAPDLPKLDHQALKDPTRPFLDFYGATVYADSIDPNTGEARGRVYLDGTVLHANNPRFPVFVYCEYLKMDVINGTIELSGSPVMRWDSAYIIAKSPETRIHLTREQYRVVGPAQYGVAPAQSGVAPTS